MSYVKTTILMINFPTSLVYRLQISATRNQHMVYLSYFLLSIAFLINETTSSVSTL